MADKRRRVGPGVYAYRNASGEDVYSVMYRNEYGQQKRVTVGTDLDAAITTRVEIVAATAARRAADRERRLNARRAHATRSATRREPPQPAKPTRTDHVYFIVSGSRVKIGHGDVNGRVASARAMNPEPIIVHRTIWCRGESAQPVEKALHRRYQSHRVHLEWFDVEPVLSDVMSLSDDEIIGMAREPRSRERGCAASRSVRGACASPDDERPESG